MRSRQPSSSITGHRRALHAGRPLVAALLIALLVLQGCTTDVPEDQRSVRVGAGSTTEQQVLAALTVELLQRNDVLAEVVPELGDTTRVRDTALDGDIDVHWDYSGAAWAMGLRLTAPPVDAQESFEAVAAEELERGLRWLGPTAVDARLAFFVPIDAAPSEEEASLSWLAGRLGAEGGGLCADAGYFSAPSGYDYLVDVYAIGTDELSTTPASEVQALELTAAGECAAGLAAATSGVAQQLDLVALIDDQGVFPALALSPVVTVDGLADTPIVVPLLITLAQLLDTGILADLNARAAEGTAIDQLAQDFLGTAGLG